MPQRNSNETIEQFAIRTAYEFGHFWSPENTDGPNVHAEDLKNLTAADPVVIRALMSLSKMDPARYTEEVLKAHGRLPDFDGELGPAMEAFVQLGRCPVPDHSPPPGVVFAFDDPDIQRVVERMQDNQSEPAQGSGGWAGCHGVGNFHSAMIRVNPFGMPSFLRPLFPEVIKRVQYSYAGVGLLLRFVDQSKTDLLVGGALSGTVNSEMSFVSNSSGWIGLAIVGQNERCDSTIWCKFLSTYQGGSTPEQIIQQWVTLIKHEIGHNTGRGHTPGGVMNSSIVNGLPTEWAVNDPSTNWMKQQFGGVPVPIPGGGPSPGPVPPVGTVESRLQSLELKVLVQDAAVQWLASEVGKMRKT